MVDSIGPRILRDVPAPVASAEKVPQGTARPSAAAKAQLELTAIAFDFDKAAKVNAAHVEEVRRAVRNGTYPILPETIADRLLALKLNWNPKR